MPRNNGGAETAEQIGHGFRVAERAKHGLNPRGPERGEEILEVETEDNATARVRGGKSSDRSPFHEAVGGGMGRDFIQNLGQNLTLQFFQMPFRCFDQSKAAV